MTKSKSEADLHHRPGDCHRERHERMQIVAVVGMTLLTLTALSSATIRRMGLEPSLDNEEAPHVDPQSAQVAAAD